MDRRTFLAVGMTPLVGVHRQIESELPVVSSGPPIFDVVPVVADGKWIWQTPPTGQTGYLEPRPFELTVGIELRGSGSVQAGTPVPAEFPEQKIDDERIETASCTARLRDVGPGARQLYVQAANLAAGRPASAIARFRLTLFKQYQDYRRDQFPAKQVVPRDLREMYVTESPGIQVRPRAVHDLARELTAAHSHPWDQAQAFARWIPRNIQGKPGPYTSVTSALKNRVGDCEEMSGVFVALCRAVGIPARLVWVPNHAWAEFCLFDAGGAEHWIPVHTACYFWFGWTGVHQLILQKGDKVPAPQGNALVRLQTDWTISAGGKPQARFTAVLRPLPIPPSNDAGPGARTKDRFGRWAALPAAESAPAVKSSARSSRSARLPHRVSAPDQPPSEQ